MDRKTNSKYN